MSDSCLRTGADAVLARLDADLDELLALPLDRHTDDQVLDVWRRVEQVRNRLAAVDHAVIGQVTTRRLDQTYAASSVAVLARDVLRVGIREARARVKAAASAGPRVGLTGEALPPVYERVAEAQASGVISAHHARVIVECVDTLPDAVQAVHGASIEAFLVEQAGVLDPDYLTQVTQRLVATLDPDGTLTGLAQRERQRDLRLHVRADGSSTMTAELTAEATEHLRVILDSLGKPRPSTEGGADPRTAGQRRHDALLDACKLVQRARQLPASGGVTSTLVLTMTQADWDADTGIAITGHGVQIPVKHARRWVDGDSRTLHVILGDHGDVLAVSDTRRCFTENQRLAMQARDRGCIFPGCDAPVQYCEAHHITDHHQGGPTCVANGCLLCGHHHREFDKRGYQIMMINDIPHVIPPRWQDHERKPIRNHVHHPEHALR